MTRLPPRLRHPASFPVLRSAVLALIFALTAACPAWAWVDPTTGHRSATHVTRRADIPEKNWLPGHRGVDLAARPGDPIRAAEEGTVAFVGVVAGTPVISIAHPDGLRSTYQPVHSRVAVGDVVAEGDVVGHLGHSSDHDGLHWGVLTGPDTYINPLSLLDAPTIRLKPPDDGIGGR
ncbi:M23 family metallopeptidase [Corynebacterium sp. LK2510]|uniref:M23 family metallopeptidase n=1 Tax=Corynebacterium sp. LK2510 TaxID=3110472 RepID=UPI0034CD4640